MSAAPRRRRLIACERGAELVEFALVFPMLLLVIVGIMDFGFLFQRYEVLTAAAREGARIAILPGYSDADVQTRVNTYLTAAGFNQPATVLVGPTQTVPLGSQCVSIRPVTVTYTHTYMFVGPLMAFFNAENLGSRPITATSAMRSENAAESCS